VANRKFRHSQKQALISFDISRLEEFVSDRIAAGYSD
jgi:hypothetical protein